MVQVAPCNTRLIETGESTGNVLTNVQTYDIENFERKGLANLYNYNLSNTEGGVFGTQRVHLTKMCIQTFIGTLEGDGLQCDDQDNAPGKQIDKNGDEIECSKYIPRKFCH